MGKVQGRAGFHAKHMKSSGERGAVLHEMMRELDEDSIEYWAARNPNIVIEDEQFNEAYVNDGQGGYKPCTDRNEVLQYGNERLQKVHRKINDKTITTSLLVAHLPKSMCEEIPDYYPRVDAAGQQMYDRDGNEMRRSRWVARDKDEARQYFMDVTEYLSSQVVSGGSDALLGFDIQHSESTPHIQLMFDAFEEHPDKPDKLRAAASRDWFVHRDVKTDAGKLKSGQQKLRDYHSGLKSFLIEKGYDISPDFDEERHMTGYTKEDYERVQDERAENREDAAKQEQQLLQREAALRQREVEVLKEKREIEKTKAHLSKDIRKMREGNARAEEMLGKARRMASRARSEKEEADNTLEDAKAVQASNSAAQQDLQQLSTVVGADIGRWEQLDGSEATRALTWLKETNVKGKTHPDGSQVKFYDVFTAADKKQRKPSPQRTFDQIQQQYGRPGNVFQSKATKRNDGPQLGG